MSTKGNSIAGRKVNDGIDFYQTPTWAIEKLLEKEKFVGEILEPCSGAGAISKVLELNGYNVISQDLREDDGVYGGKGKDIFNIDTDYHIDNIVTNPPFCVAQEFIEKSLHIANNKVVMLLKLSFLEGAKRFDFFQNTPLKKIYVFCKRVTMYPEGTEKPKNSGTIAYAWFVWEKGYEGQPMVDWIL